MTTNDQPAAPAPVPAPVPAPRAGPGAFLARLAALATPSNAIAAAGVFVAAWATLFPLTDGDMFWHLAAGRQMVATGDFLYEDPFSYVTEGVRWTDVHWLFQLFSYGVHTLAGVPGLVVAKVAVFALACALLLAGVRRRETVAPAAVLLAAAAYSVRFLVLARPIIFSLVYVAVFLLVLAAYRRTRTWRVLVALPLVQVLWANTQGIHALGPVIVACILAGELVQRYAARAPSRLVTFEQPLELRELVPVAWALGATLLASLVSPYGLRGALLPWTLFARVDPGLADLYSWNVSENVPTWSIMRDEPWRMTYVTAFTLVGLASFAAARRGASVARLALFVAFLYLGLQAERNVVLYMVVLVHVTVANANVALDDPRVASLAARARAWVLGGCSAALVGVAVLTLVAQAREASLTGLAPFRHPVAAAHLLARETPDGAVFNSVRYGGYLIWRLYPHRKVFIDGRLVIRTPEQFREYLAMLDRPELFEPARAAWNITRAVLPTAVFPRYLPLVKHLWRDPAWSVMHADGSSILLAYRAPASAPRVDLASASGVEAILEGLAREWEATPRVHAAARLNLAAFLLYLDLPDRCEQALGDDGTLDAMRLRAHARYVRGDVAGAFALCERLIAGDPADVRSLDLAGRIHLDAGRVREALECYRRALEVDPYDASAREAVERVGAPAR